MQSVYRAGAVAPRSIFAFTLRLAAPSWHGIFAALALLTLALLAIPGDARAQVRTIFDNGNVYTVENGASQPTVFALGVPTTIVRIQTYHWNYGQGAPAGTIALRRHTGQIYGPWQAVGLPGQGGVPSAYWVVETNIVLPPGNYTVLDADPSTWAQNAGTGGAGMASISGY
jgi:hypothetical protein